MDLLRSGYRTQMRFDPAQPDRSSPVRWYRCPPGAKIFPKAHSFISLNWYKGSKLPDSPIGELQAAPRSWSNGKTPVEAHGLQLCVSPDLFLSGTPYLLSPRVEYPDGFPTCCNAPPPVVVTELHAVGGMYTVAGGSLLVVTTDSINGPIGGGIAPDTGMTFNGLPMSKDANVTDSSGAARALIFSLFVPASTTAALLYTNPLTFNPVFAVWQVQNLAANMVRGSNSLTGATWPAVGPIWSRSAPGTEVSFGMLDAAPWFGHVTPGVDALTGYVPTGPSGSAGAQGYLIVNDLLNHHFGAVQGLPSAQTWALADVEYY